MGTKKQTVKQESSSSLPKEFVPYYQRMFGRAESALGQVPTTPYGGEFVAKADPLQYQGLDQRLAAAQTLPGNFGQSVMQLGEDTARGKYLHPESNPYLQGMLAAINRDTTDAYQRNLLPSLRSDATGAGAFSGVRRDLAEAQLTSDTQRNLLENANTIYGQNYAAERGYQASAPQLLEQGARLSQLPGMMTLDIGEYRRQLQQDALENELAKYEDRITAPFRGISQALPVYGLNVGMDTRGSSRTRTPGMFSSGGGLYS